MRKLMLLLAAGSLWLFLAAVPVFADGGPHQKDQNSGVSSLASDGCAGCHRAHTAKGEMLINAATEEELCLTCHGAASSGSTADVMTGIQYAIGAGGLRTVITRDITAVTGTTITTSAAHGFAVGQFVAISGLGGVVDGTYTVATAPTATTFTLTLQTPTTPATYVAPFPTATVSDTSTQLGALRGGGFDQARMASGAAARIFKTSFGSVWAKVTVGAAADVTSSHLNLATNGLTAPSVAWGNDGYGSGVGATVSLGCASCHNPHGNGKYRILNPIPAPAATTSGTFVPVAAPGATVTDAALPAAGDARNYTVIQVKPAAGGTYMLLASDVLDAFKISDGNPATIPTKFWPAGTYNSSAGDYWHVRVPWNSASGTADAPNGVPGGPSAFTTQMAAWCTACHTRYLASQGSPVNPSGDPDFMFRHPTDGSATTCTTCHVSHGSNARMGGTFSLDMPFPDGTSVSYDIGGATGDSRLLKVDNRGTCQLCHDPTDTVLAGTYTGPTTVPGVP